MKTSIWYNSKDGQVPDKQGYYLTFVGVTLACNETSIQLSYFDHVDKNGRPAWYDNHTSNSNWANVVYWTDANLYEWYEKEPDISAHTMTPAEQDAWEAVKQAIEKYETVKALCR